MAQALRGIWGCRKKVPRLTLQGFMQSLKGIRESWAGLRHAPSPNAHADEAVFPQRLPLTGVTIESTSM
jgi:hypothetical protein